MIARSRFLALALSSFPASTALAGGMYVESCNLGCSSGAGGAPVTAQIVDVFQDQELRVRFSLPVDLASVDLASFQVVKVADGTRPPGTFTVDLLDERTLVFTPALAFDANGLPVFGFEAGTAYSILLPGSAQGDPGPFVRSTGGLDNQSRFQHTILTSMGLLGPIRDTCAALTNSVGSGTSLAVTGTTSLSTNAMTMTVADAPPSVAGVFFSGTQPRSLPLGQGVRCVGGGILRLASVVTDTGGAAVEPLDLTRLGAAPGELRFLQFWHRDLTPSGAPGSNLSGAVRVQVYP